jgi:hypothetical protein
MVTAPTLPVVELVKHRAQDWTRAQRAEMSDRLAAMGTTITELSDARELAGRPRLSSSTATQRHYAPLWLLGEAGQGWLLRARSLRALLTEALASVPREDVATARHLLGLHRAAPSAWRLCELQAAYAQARHLALQRETWR